jgi:hypothetical protein
MAVRHLYTHVSEFAIRDTAERISFINIINNVTLDEIPGALVCLFIGVGFTGGEGQTFRVSMEDPKRNQVFRSEEEIIPAPSENAAKTGTRFVSNAVYMLKPVVFLMEGTHQVVFRVGNKVIHKEPIPVIKVVTREESEINADNR